LAKKINKLKTEGYLEMLSKYDLYKKEIVTSFDNLNSENFDFFISAFEPCERVTTIYEKINAKNKYWLIFPQYEIPNEKKPKAEFFENESASEDDYFKELFDKFPVDKNQNICIDITGFPRPHLIYLIRLLAFKKFLKINIIYTEPKQYAKGENTAFSGFIDDIRIIPGCGPADNNPITDNDVLIIGSGYDDKLMAKIAQFKRNCKIKFEVFGFPSLQADMYQESRLKSADIKESIGENVTSCFAPAYDPFITAELLKTIVDGAKDATNFYLSPLSSKPQVLGFAYYFCKEGYNLPLSIIYPYSSKYLMNTTTGINRTWRYVLEF
jgi:hypothetical protein